MASINLSQPSAEKSGSAPAPLFDKSFLISMGLLIVSFGTLFGLKAYNASLESNVDTVNSDITTQLAELNGDTVNRVIDFQERMSKIDEKLAVKDVSVQDLFPLVEKSMVSGAFLNTYAYDVSTKILSLSLTAPDFKTVARQVMSFKSVNVFKGVTVENASKTVDKGIKFDMVISL